MKFEYVLLFGSVEVEVEVELFDSIKLTCWIFVAFFVPKNTSGYN